MYKYTSMKKTSGWEGIQEAQDELYINGESITSKVSGYRQLTVSGRGLTPYTVETVQYLRRSGARPTSYRTEPKDFTIKYLIESETSEGLRDRYGQIMGILGQGMLEISFKDDEGYFYKDVYLTGADSQEEDTNTIVSTFSLTAYDPYKYSKEKSEGKVVDIDTENVRVDKIKVNFEEDVNRPEIIINNGIYNTSFRLVGDVKSGTEFELSINQDGRINTKGAKIEMATLPRELILYNGATGYVKGSMESEVLFEWRDKRL